MPDIREQLSGDAYPEGTKAEQRAANAARVELARIEFEHRNGLVSRDPDRTRFEDTLDYMEARAATDSERSAISDMRSRSRLAHEAARNLAAALRKDQGHG